MPDQHFFVCDACTWITDANIEKAIKRLRKERNAARHNKPKSYNVFVVPLPETTSYDIDMYQPQVDGTQYLGNFDY